MLVYVEKALLYCSTVTTTNPIAITTSSTPRRRRRTVEISDSTGFLHSGIRPGDPGPRGIEGRSRPGRDGWWTAVRPTDSEDVTDGYRYLRRGAPVDVLRSTRGVIGWAIAHRATAPRRQAAGTRIRRPRARPRIQWRMVSDGRGAGRRRRRR